MVIGWFSCGVTSAIACKLAIDHFGKDKIKLFYFDTGAAHEDNKRFIAECENWFQVSIETRKSKKWNSPLHVASKQYFNGPYGAPCTLQLKKQIRFDIEKEIPNYEAQVFGFEFSKKEINRAIRFKEQYPAAKPYFPLIANKLTKQNCMSILAKNNIDLPYMYKLGYANNNCIGCFKGGKGYWNQIKKDFPKTFEETAKMERQRTEEMGQNVTCIKGKFLDELKPNEGRKQKILLPDCGTFCDIEGSDIIDSKVEKYFNEEISFEELLK